jgi:poly-gamma-glutamate synthesis protein (capsule biosynthesis protein)
MRRMTVVGMVLTLAALPALDPPAVDGAAGAGAGAFRITRPLRTMPVVAGGDVLNEGVVNNAGAAVAVPPQRYDFAPLFAPVASIVGAADLAICHMEIPVGRAGAGAGVYGRSPYGGNLLLAPYEIAAGLAATGFDRCSTASNHSNDLGRDGIASTLEALDAAGISHAGTARSPAESAPEVFTVNGIRVAHLSYSTYSNTVWPTDRWALARASSPEQVAAAVNGVRAAGAEVVIVSLHLPKEMLYEPIPADRVFATRLTELADVDLIVHHGPHVVQPVETVNGTLVYWSVGNFVSGMGRPGTGRYSDPRTSDGLLATVRFTETAPGEFTAVSMPVLLCNEQADRTVRAPVSELARARATGQPLDPTLETELRACLARGLAMVPDGT